MGVEMKFTKILSATLLLLLLTGNCLSQYQIIFTAPVNRTINNFMSIFHNYNNNPFVYLSLSGHSINAQSPYWVRYYKAGNQWINNPHYNFLSGMTCFNGLGGFQFSGIGNFIRSPIDTNFILGRWDWISCNTYESGYTNRMSWNSGYNYTEFSSSCGRSFDIDTVNEKIYSAGGGYLSNAKLWISTDKGNSWTYINIPGVSYQEPIYIKLNPVNRSIIYLTSTYSMLKSTDGGQTIEHISELSSVPCDLAIDKIDESIYYASNYYGIYKSTNAGLNFSLKFNLSTTKILINPDNHNIIYAGTINNGLYRSTNSGANWERYFDLFGNSLTVTGILKYRNDGDTIYASNNTNVYKIWGKVVGINIISTEIPKTFLLYQNYPNPFNPSTKIKFDIPQSPLYPEHSGGVGGFISLKVYDILGNEVSTLVNEQLKPGTYEVEWPAPSGDGSNFSSGVYYYTLTTNSFKETKRMVLIK
jgi:hypothetical protein